ncbi:MAG: hypothetical protein ACOX0X_03420 [Candidatus Dojkabacteria bacterium]
MKKTVKYLTILLLFVIPFCTKTFGEELLYTPHPNFDYVAVNNILASKEEEGFLKIYRDDVIKIAGIGEVGKKIVISLDKEKYETTVDQYGNWFVIFSVQDLDMGSYPVTIEIGNSKKKEHLITLIVEKGDRVEMNNSLNQENEQNSGVVRVGEIEIDSKTKNILCIILLPTLFVIGVVVGIYIGKRIKK